MKTVNGKLKTDPPVIVIVGPTASGKSDLALSLAERYGGEIICADSRTVYKGMDVGTAKPSMTDQARAPHHLLDMVEPNERFTAADFQRLAGRAIEDIHARGKIPFVVGGTGLYIDGLILHYTFDSNHDEDLRSKLADKSTNELLMMLKRQHLNTPNDPLNKRHLIRALEKGISVTEKKAAPSSNIYVAGIATDKIILENRIRDRAKIMFDSGVIEEAQKLGEKYGWEVESMKSNIYPIARRVIKGEIDIPAAIELCITRDKQLAKRQMTWFKRHNFIHWGDSEQASANISARLSHSLSDNNSSQSATPRRYGPKT